jgi:phosphoribosyl 1,2-cyclic phosphodiesterase
MKITFWGVRGSIAVSGAEYARTGGNTTCIEVQHAGERLILDGGTGLRALGSQRR